MLVVVTVSVSQLTLKLQGPGCYVAGGARSMGRNPSVSIHHTTSQGGGGKQRREAAASHKGAETPITARKIEQQTVAVPACDHLRRGTWPAAPAPFPLPPCVTWAMDATLAGKVAAVLRTKS